MRIAAERNNEDLTFSFFLDHRKGLGLQNPKIEKCRPDPNSERQGFYDSAFFDMHIL